MCLLYIFKLILWALVLGPSFQCWEDSQGEVIHLLPIENKLQSMVVRACPEVGSEGREEGWGINKRFLKCSECKYYSNCDSSQQPKTRHPLAGLGLSWINNLTSEFNQIPANSAAVELTIHFGISGLNFTLCFTYLLSLFPFQ